MRNAFPEIAKQLRHLMDAHTPPIKGGHALAAAMLDVGVLEYSQTKGVTKKESIDNKARSINLHLNGGKVDTEWICHYCDFFKCSSDYLLGYIEYPTQEKTDIATATGLSESSIDKLIYFKEKKTSGNKEALDALNYMMSLDEFPELLIKLEKYYRQCREDVKLQKPTPDLTAEEYGRKVTDLNNQMSESEYFIVKYFGQIIDEFKAAAEKNRELSIPYSVKSDRKIRPRDPANDSE